MNFSHLKTFLPIDKMAGTILHEPQVKYSRQNVMWFKIDLDPGYRFELVSLFQQAWEWKLINFVLSTLFIFH